MRVYFNTSALNRPFDDLSSQRVRLEAEAMVALLAAVEDGVLEWVGSEYLDFEVSQDPDRERVRRLSGLIGLAATRVETSDAVAERARALERLKLRGLDALHIASAEAGQADLLVTTDDRMIPGRASRAQGTGAARWTRRSCCDFREEAGPMSTVRLTNAEIRARGWEALVAGLGPSGALRFVLQTERGQGDYGARRHRLLGRLSVDELLARMGRRRPPRRPRRRRS